MIQQQLTQDITLKELLNAISRGMMGDVRGSLELEEQTNESIDRALKAFVQAAKQDQDYLDQQAARIAAVRKNHRLKDILEMDPKDFEYWSAGYLLDQGYRDAVVVPPGRDKGVDIFITCPNRRKAIVQCKRYQEVIGRPLIDQFYATMLRWEVKSGIFVTTSRFSPEAVETAALLSKKVPILLIDGEQLTKPRPAAKKTATVNKADPATHKRKTPAAPASPESTRSASKPSKPAAKKEKSAPAAGKAPQKSTSATKPPVEKKPVQKSTVQRSQKTEKGNPGDQK